MKKTIAVLGYGALSHIFLDIFREKLAGAYELAGVLTRTVPEDPAGLTFFPDLDALLAAKPDYVTEFVGGEAVRQYGQTILSSGISMILVSIGALADDSLYEALRNAAQTGGAGSIFPPVRWADLMRCAR